MDPYEKELRTALFNVAEEVTRDIFSPDTVNWTNVYQLVHRLSEISMTLPEAEKIPAQERRQLVEEMTIHTIKLIRENAIGGLIPGVMLLVWRCFMYSVPHLWQERSALFKPQMDKKSLEAMEALIYRMWKDYWDHFQPGLLRDPRGVKPKWSIVTLMNAVNKAATTVPAARWSYDAVAEKITQNELLNEPLTGEALRKLITRNRLNDFWKKWEEAKSGQKN